MEPLKGMAGSYHLKFFVPILQAGVARSMVSANQR